MRDVFVTSWAAAPQRRRAATPPLPRRRGAAGTVGDDTPGQGAPSACRPIFVLRLQFPKKNKKRKKIGPSWLFSSV